METYIEEPCEGKLSRTVLKTSTGSDPAAEFNSGRVCVGSHVFPRDPLRVPAEFFASHFKATADTRTRRSQKHPDDVGALWQELAGTEAFPMDDLVKQLTTADAFNLAAR